VIDVGDSFLRPPVEVVDPIELTIDRGRIVRIEGGWSARFLERWLDQWDDERSYTVSTIAWGAHDRARWHERRRSFGADVIERYNYYGNIPFGFGSNLLRSPARYCGSEGKSRAPSRIVATCLGQSLYLDDELIIDKGKIVDPRCR
jgi:2,5-dihydroxypyridine 5,6-dioxygenase